jgi:hypothetical protein
VKKNSAPRIVMTAVGFLLVLALGIMTVTGFIPVREGPSVSSGGDAGYSYLVRILRKLGYRVRILYSMPDLEAGSLEPGDALVPLGGGRDLSGDWEAIEEWTREGGRVFLPADVKTQDAWPWKEAESAFGDLIAAEGASAGAKFPLSYEGMAFPSPIPSIETIASVAGHPVFARTRLAEGEIVYVAASEVFSNGALKRGGEEYAAFLNGLFLPSRPGTVAFYRERGWAKSGNDPIKALFSGPFLPATLQVLLAFAVFAAGAALRFGRPQRLDPRAPRSTAAHLDAVGAFYARGRSEDMADEANAEHFLAELRKSLGLSARASAEAVAGRIAPGSGRGREFIIDLLSARKGLRRGGAARRSAERYAILRGSDSQRRAK